jgi:four helix bundle protein
MASVRRYQDLYCFQAAVALRRAVLKAVRDGPAGKDFKFSGQIRDAARSAPRNIAEGYSRFNPSQILPFCSYAKASLDETKNHIDDGAEDGYFTPEQTEDLLTLAGKALGALGRWMQYLESPAARRFYKEHKANRATQEFKPCRKEP